MTSKLQKDLLLSDVIQDARKYLPGYSTPVALASYYEVQSKTFKLARSSPRRDAAKIRMRLAYLIIRPVYEFTRPEGRN